MNHFRLYTVVFIFISLLQACTSNSPAPQAISKDALIIQQLEASGKDLSKARNIEFFLYFPEQSDAQRAANSLEAEGYTIEQSMDDFKKMWLVLATKKVTPSEPTLITLRQKFEKLTSQANGKYLDWGTPMAE